VVSSLGDAPKKPRVEVGEDILLTYCRLVKLGYGSLKEVKELDARTVLQALYYEDFCDNYVKAFYEANK